MFSKRRKDKERSGAELKIGAHDYRYLNTFHNPMNVTVVLEQAEEGVYAVYAPSLRCGRLEVFELGLCFVEPVMSFWRVDGNVGKAEVVQHVECVWCDSGAG